MKYFIDTEFLEGVQKESFPISLFRNNTPPTVDLISIGLVSEDGREYYAISKDFNLKEAWNRYQMKQVYGDFRNTFPEGVKEYWIRENVLKPIYYQWIGKDIKFHEIDFTYNDFKKLLNKYGKTNKEIAEEICQFIDARWVEQGNINKGFIHPGGTSIKEVKTVDAKFYGYFADYDWVVFCWLFGKMIDLPKGFPMYCIDLKQMLDEKVTTKKVDWGENATNFDMLNHIKTLPDYPKQENEHNSLADARWNKKLYEFLTKIIE